MKEKYTLFLPGEHSCLIRDFIIDCGDIFYYCDDRGESFIIKKGASLEGLDENIDKEKNLLTGLMACFSGFRFCYSQTKFRAPSKKLWKNFFNSNNLEEKTIYLRNFFSDVINAYYSENKVKHEYIAPPYIPTHGEKIIVKNNLEFSKLVKDYYKKLGSNNVFINTILAYLNKSIVLFSTGFLGDASLNLSLLEEAIVLYFKSEYLISSKHKIKSLKEVKEIKYKEICSLLENNLNLEDNEKEVLKFFREVRGNLVAHVDLKICDGRSVHWGIGDFLWFEHIPVLNNILLKFLDYLFSDIKKTKTVNTQVCNLNDFNFY